MGQQAYDPHNPEMKIKDCIVMRVYSTHVDDETKEVYSYPIAHEAIDLYSLQLRSIQVSEQFHSSKSISIVPSPANLLHTGEAASSSPQLDLAHILHHAPPQAQKPGEAQPTSTPKQYAHAQPIYAHIREYDFPLHANFCNSFVLTSVLPVWGKVFHASPDAAKEGANLPEDITHACMFEVQPGILMAHSHDDAYIQGTLAKMRSELDRLQTGVKAFVADRDSKIKTQMATTASASIAQQLPAAVSAAGGSAPHVDLSQHVYMPSVLRNIHYTQKVVKLQQALQQAYCMHGVETANVVLSEPNSMQFASGATCLQLHRASVTFPFMTAIHNARCVCVSFCACVCVLYYGTVALSNRFLTMCLCAGCPPFPDTSSWCSFTLPWPSVGSPLAT